MKFPQLQRGQRFRWHDQLYCKTGPLTAVAEADGNTRIFSRSAIVTLLDGSADAEPTNRSLDPERIRMALDAMTARLEDAAQALAADAGVKHAQTLRRAIEDARQGFVEQTGLSTRATP
jgi:hypothetical protein